MDPANPQTWNRYAYVSNNPLSFINPLGLEGTLQCADSMIPGCMASSGDRGWTIKVDVSAPFDQLDPGTIDSLNSFLEQSSQNSLSQVSAALLSPWGGQKGTDRKADGKAANNEVPQNPCNYAGRNLDPSACAAMGQGTKNNPFTTAYDFAHGFSIGGYLDAQPMATGGTYEKAA